MSTVHDEKKTAPSKPALHKPEHPANKFEGCFVSFRDNKVVMKNKDGKEYTHTLSKDAKITCDGAVCKSEELKVGGKIRVTTMDGNNQVVTALESLNKQTEFAHCGG